MATAMIVQTREDTITIKYSLKVNFDYLKNGIYPP